MIVTIVRNPMDPRSWSRHDTDDLIALLSGEFGAWPSTARVYDLGGIGALDRMSALMDGQALSSRDVTPMDERGCERLERCKGPLLVTIPPADPITIIIAVVATVLAILIAVLLVPKLPTPDKTRSSNRSLSDRSNKARPDERIEDNYGTIRAVPSLIAVPYRIFDTFIEYEISYMCVGRGAYEVQDVRDGDTLLFEEAGASCEFYEPFESPNSGDYPQLSIGIPINTPVLTIIPISIVNGQLLRPPNANSFRGDNDTRFIYPDTIQTRASFFGTENFDSDFSPGDTLIVNDADFGIGAAGTTTVQESSRFEDGGIVRFETYDPSVLFTPGATITISNAGFAEQVGSAVVYVDLSGIYIIDLVDSTTITLSAPNLINTDWDRLTDLTSDRTDYRTSTFSVPTETSSLNLDGSYTILAVTTDEIVLSNPATVNAAWNNIAGLSGGATTYGSPRLTTLGTSWAGPFVIDLDGLDRIIMNFVAPAGMYYLNDKGKQRAWFATLEAEITPVDLNDDPIGPSELFDITLNGTAKTKDARGVTLIAQPSFTGRCSVRCRRTTDTNDASHHQPVDDVKWREMYGASPVAQLDFGNITSVMTKTYATSGATAAKDRKFNILARRKLPQRISGSNFTTSLVGTDDIADIMSSICLDPYIGGRTIDEVDFDSLYDTSDAIAAYFGSELARHFSYTFDDDSVSFEETLAIVAQAVFCTAYRLGSQIKIAFEQATEDSKLLFNQRNVLPDTQKRTVRFGILDDQNGVEVDYFSPRDGSKLIVALPPYSTSTSPRQIDVPGLSTLILAYWQAWRSWNRMKYQNIAVELEATQEAALLIRNDRILIADLTRPEYLSGEVDKQDGTTLTLAQPVDLDRYLEYQIFLQLTDGTVQSIPVDPWLDGDGVASDQTKVTLATMPRLPLVVDDAQSVKTLFTIAAVDDVQTRAFLIGERGPNSNFTENVSAVNYSFLYYQNDQLMLWFPIILDSLVDESAWANAVIPFGPGSIVADGTRGKNVYSGTGFGSVITFSPILNSFASYTKMAWVNATDGNILSTPNESFFIAAGHVLNYHGGDEISAALSAGWHLVTATYDHDTTLSELYVDGAFVTSGNIRNVAAAELRAFDSFNGLGDELRLYPRVLTDHEIRELYLATRA